VTSLVLDQLAEDTFGVVGLVLLVRLDRLELRGERLEQVVRCVVDRILGRGPTAGSLLGHGQPP
jgi:hypothetical protein